MPISLQDWKKMPEGKEKYQAYLCSREWSLLREKVRRRANGICERCLTNEMDAVHHLTYKRKYNERLEDLQAICDQCHDFTHGKSNIDYRTLRPVFVCEKPVRSFYLAGKITQSPWRNEIVSGWSYENKSINYQYSRVADSDGKTWARVFAAAESVKGVHLDYTGPWWSAECTGGHSSLTDSVAPHAYGRTYFDNHGIEFGPDEGQVERAREMVSRLVREAVSEADMIFAWIDSDDCLGTMLEIGMARAMKKVVVVASPSGFDATETWLARSLADFCVFASGAGVAWRHFWENLVETKPRALTITSQRMKK